MTEKKLSEKLRNGVTYAITINPDDRTQHIRLRQGTASRWSAVRRSVLSDLTPYLVYLKDIKIYPDLSSPSFLGSDKYPRIHYHGIIEFKDIIGFLTNAPTGLTHYMIDYDTIEDPKIWDKYMLKFIKRFPEYEMYTIKIDNLKALTPQKQPTLKEVLETYPYQKFSPELNDNESDDSDED